MKRKGGPKETMYSLVKILSVAVTSFRYNYSGFSFQNVPADKLLVYEVSEGWDPLCKFLEVAVPNKPFPHKNKRGGFFKEAVQSAKVVERMKQEMYIAFSIFGIIMALGIYKIGKSKITIPASLTTNWIKFMQNAGSWLSCMWPSR